MINYAKKCHNVIIDKQQGYCSSDIKPVSKYKYSTVFIYKDCNMRNNMNNEKTMTFETFKNKPKTSGFSVTKICNVYQGVNKNVGSWYKFRQFLGL